MTRTAGWSTCWATADPAPEGPGTHPRADPGPGTPSFGGVDTGQGAGRAPGVRPTRPGRAPEGTASPPQHGGSTARQVLKAKESPDQEHLTSLNAQQLG
ncbi:hypothetical protein GCM10010495_59300 [Kitasatospora herbaricolor]|nr:hypothetical protein GCM10010495_59300 [Kitasatospora herbaricolor]